MRSTADQYCVPTVLPEYNQLSKTKRGGQQDLPSKSMLH